MNNKYEKVKYGDEVFLIDKTTGQIKPKESKVIDQGRRKEQKRASYKMVAYAGLALLVMIIGMAIVNTLGW